MTRKIVRCAVYTRKSTEAGLDQDFNSLAAQREAAEAYIRSQRSEGWRLVKTKYDDGGFSGGNIERPALKALLADIDDNKINAVLVYKVDRLTRSLADFSKLIELFDTSNVAFVSVTQQFNTSTSMGRLTLNVLLSFAQFEREITSERLKDKILASRKKGIWMGGEPPMGYDPIDKRLVVNQRDAEIVGDIFRRYLKHGSIAKVTCALAQDGILTRRRTSIRSGRQHGGRRFSRGHIKRVLTNRTYLGEAVHKGVSYEGQHEAIVPREIFDAVQALLAKNRQAVESGARYKTKSLLKGMFYDDAGNRMSPSHSKKGERRYRYYVSQAVLHGEKNKMPSLTRIAASEIEPIVSRALIEFLSDKAQPDPSRPSADPEMIFKRAAVLIDRIMVSCTETIIRLKDVPSTCAGKILRGDAPETPPGHRPVLEIRRPIRVARSGGRTRIVSPDSREPLGATRQNSILRAVVRGYAWRRRLETGKDKSLADLARREGVSDRYVSRLLKFGYLAPTVIESILNDERYADISLLDVKGAIPHSWNEQHKKFAAILGES